MLGLPRASGSLRHRPMSIVSQKTIGTAVAFAANRKESRRSSKGLGRRLELLPVTAA
jgi:hypothetical protein